MKATSSLQADDQVAIDAISAKIMGLTLRIPFIKMAYDEGLGWDPDQIELLGDDISGLDFRFSQVRALLLQGTNSFEREGFFS